jgi:glyoxylase-like metal-dependent hydrolase (beta-lactamase superfamily II)
MITLDILAVGDLEQDKDGSVLKADSTSVLIRTPDHNIVVDTSTKYLKPALKTSFQQIGVFIRDVDIVVLTHSHMDHRENLDMFPKAKVYIHSGSDLQIPGAVVVEDEEYQLCDGVKLVHTPGHCPEEMSVFVEADRKYVVAGDAIPLEDNYRLKVPPRLNTDREKAIESMDRIAKYADVIIPGHGFPFMAD